MVVILMSKQSEIEFMNSLKINTIYLILKQIISLFWKIMALYLEQD